MNYPIIALIVILALALVGFLIWKNLKDQKKIEQEMNESEIRPEKHNENHPKV
jgi:uncharacterized membrane-anchored protein YhcB (DUF1043 family)